MGAHEIPDAFRGRNRDYLDHLLGDVLPQVQEKRLAEFVDIFCEDGYFSYADAEYYLGRAAALGFKIKLHADEFTSNNAAELAARLNAVSAEHLIAISDEEIAENRRLRYGLRAAARRLLLSPPRALRPGAEDPGRARHRGPGHAISIPGSSMISSQLFIFHLAVFQMGLTIEQALNAVTINAAYAIDRQQQVGSLAVGKEMDLLLLDIPDYQYLAYHPGINPVRTVLKAGKVVVRDRQVAAG